MDKSMSKPFKIRAAAAALTMHLLFAGVSFAATFDQGTSLRGMGSNRPDILVNRPDIFTDLENERGAAGPP